MADDIADFDLDLIDGHIAPLLERLRNDATPLKLSMAERRYIASRLEGKINHAPHRQKSLRLFYQQLDIAKYYVYLTEATGAQQKAACSFITEQTGRKKSSILNDLKIAKAHYGAKRWEEIKRSHRIERRILDEYKLAMKLVAKK
jgi:hypothetical protein